MATKAASALSTADTIELPDGDHAVVNVWLTPNTAYQAGESGPGLGYPANYVSFEVAGIGSGPTGVNNILFTVPAAQTFTTS
jgi:hypothetical protein